MYENQWRFWRCVANVDLLVDIGRSFNILKVFIILKKHDPVHVNHENAFLKSDASIRACELKTWI